VARNGYASFVGTPQTRVTTLENGFTVATEAIPHAETSTVGVWIDAGSRAETEQDNGAAHFLEHMAFKGLEMEVEDMGGHLNAYTSREQTVYYAKSFKHDVPRAVDILSDILQNSLLEEGAENIKSLKRTDLLGYIKKNYTADRMVLAAAGGVDHDLLVHYARGTFGNLRNGHGAHRLDASPAPTFTGSELRVTDDAAPQTHFALAVEGVGWSSSDYYPMLVMQTMIGSWDRTFGVTEHERDRLSNVSARRNLCKSYMAFNTAYTDTGLFGMYVITENTKDMTEVVELSLKEWARLAAPGISKIE
ncbi:MAG: Metalloenzyme, LuxS/M16 peptidase-like protein, partial [Olpidium bornovanus]